MQFGIKKVVVGESKNFQGVEYFLKSYDVEVVDIDSSECIDMMSVFIKENPQLWNEDISNK